MHRALLEVSVISPQIFHITDNAISLVFISFGFPFLFLKEKFLFMNPVTIPEPTQRHWNDKREFILLRSTAGKVVFTLLYLAFNLYVVIDPLIPPYVDGNGIPLQVQGWWYGAIIAAICFAGTVYYYSVFGLTTDSSGDVDLKHQKRTLLRVARAYPKLHEAPFHEPHYGVRRWVEVVNFSPVSHPTSRELLS